MSDEEQAPHAFVPSGYLQHSLLSGMEYEPCRQCWLPKENPVHADAT